MNSTFTLTVGALTTSAVLLWLAGLSLLLVIGLALLRPGSVLRGALWILCHTVYRLRIKGRDHLPAAGPALLVCNHVTYFDWLFIIMGQRRTIRFVIFAGWTKVWGLGRLLKWAGVIPIDQWSGPRAIVKSLNLAAESLKNGEVVCIFAEGRFTRNGFLLPFNRGFEQIVKRHPAPIIPVCLEQAWGSIFSYRGGKLIWKWPQIFPYPVTVAYGQPMAATSKAIEVRLAIQKMSADDAIERTSQRPLVHRRFMRQAGRHPFRSCIIDFTSRQQPLSYGRVLVEAMTLARLLGPRLDAQQRVGICLPVSGRWAIANIALALLGKTAVNLNVETGIDENRKMLAMCEVKLIITARSFATSTPPPGGDGITLIDLDGASLRCSAARKAIAWLSVLLLPAFILDRFVLRLRTHHHSDVAAVLRASAHADKGVMLTHANIAANVESMIQSVDVRPSDRLLAALPLSQAFGYTGAFWLPLQVGASVVFSETNEIGSSCRQAKATLFLATNELLQSCLNKCKPGDFVSLRLVMCGSEELPSSLVQSFKDKFAITPLQGFGMTELSPAATVNIPDREIDGFLQVGNKPGTIGQPMPGTTAQIVDPRTLKPLPPGETGLLLFYGANVMAGYLGETASDEKVIHQGWFNTGKRAVMDDDGFITLVKHEDSG